MVTKVNQRMYVPNIRHVRDFGAVGGGIVDDAAAIQSAIDDLPSDGGVVEFDDTEDYLINTGLTVTQANFPSGGVEIRMQPRTRLTCGSGVVGITFSSATPVSPLDRCSIESGQIISSFATGQGAVKLENTTRFSLYKRPLFSGFRETGATDGTRYGLWAEYALWLNLGDGYINNCDTGVRVEENDVNTYRSTNLVSNATISRCHRGYELKDLFHARLYGSVENCSAGMYMHGEKTTGTNCRGLLIATYFERNGAHIISRNVSSAKNFGFDIERSLFENLNTTFSGGVDSFAAIAGVTPGVTKVDLECDLTTIQDCTWSSAATNDIVLSGDENTIGRQDAAAGTVSDRIDLTNATGTLDLITKNESRAMATADLTPSVELGHTFTITNGSAQDIDGFDGGYTGKTIYVRALDGNTTMKHTSALRMQGGIDVTMSSAQVIGFVRHSNNQWNEI